MSNLKEMTREERLAAADKARTKKAQISAAVNTKSVTASLQRGRLSDEVPSIRTAIKWKCFDCMGWESDGSGSLKQRVRECECPHCPLYPWRGGEFDMEFVDV
jgi:hypothetical protein